MKEKWWGDVQDRLKKLANGIDKGLDAYATTVQHTPYWVAENPPMLTVLKKALDEGDYFTRESFCEEILPFVAKKVLEMDSLFKKDQLPVRSFSTIVCSTYALYVGGQSCMTSSHRRRSNPGYFASW